MKIFFKSRQEEYQKAHKAELAKFNKAKRVLSEQGFDEPSFKACREMWDEKMASLEEEIKIKSEEIKTSPISEEVKMLGYIKDAVDFVADKKNSDGDGDGGDAASGGERMSVSDDSEKETQDKARQEQARQAAQLQAQQQSQVSQHGHRKRVSLKNDLAKKIDVVKKYDEDRQAAIARGEITTKKHDDQNLS